MDGSESVPAVEDTGRQVEADEGQELVQERTGDDRIVPEARQTRDGHGDKPRQNPGPKPAGGRTPAGLIHGAARWFSTHVADWPDAKKFERIDKWLNRWRQPHLRHGEQPVALRAFDMERAAINERSDDRQFASMNVAIQTAVAVAAITVPVLAATHQFSLEASISIVLFMVFAAALFVGCTWGLQQLGRSAIDQCARAAADAVAHQRQALHGHKD